MVKKISHGQQGLSVDAAVLIISTTTSSGNNSRKKIRLNIVLQSLLKNYI